VKLVLQLHNLYWYITVSLWLKLSLLIADIKIVTKNEKAKNVLTLIKNTLTAVTEVLLGVVHKRRPQSDRRSYEGVCQVWTFFGQGRRGVLQMRTSALFGK